MRIFGVILAGGGAQRMGGQDKALLKLGGQSLLSHVRDRLVPQVERFAISANGDAARFGADVTVLPDAQSQGPLSGILAGLDWAAALGATAIVSVAVDTPFFPPDLVPRLCLAAENSPDGVALAASGGHDHPTFSLWPVGVRNDLRAFLGSGAKPRIMDFARNHAAARAEFEDDAAFLNLNTPGDLVAATKLIETTA
jgi:molybdenum cofactor guanylyltransferase